MPFGPSVWPRLALVFCVSCSGGRDYLMGDPAPSSATRPRENGWVGEASGAPNGVQTEGEPPPAGLEDVTAPSAPVSLADNGADALFRNTYYDFPREGAGPQEATLFDAACKPLGAVTQAFHDALCVQGSGRLRAGGTVSFARRDCACAALCPRTNQHICYEALDPARFPHGRGATGKAITPFRTVAVDTSVIPMGSRLRIPELVGLPLPDGSRHDGCFIAEDRGLRVVGRHIDVFTGDPAMTARWNELVPSNGGVHVEVGAARCAGPLFSPTPPR